VLSKQQSTLLLSRIGMASRDRPAQSTFSAARIAYPSSMPCPPITPRCQMACSSLLGMEQPANWTCPTKLPRITDSFLSSKSLADGRRVSPTLFLVSIPLGPAFRRKNKRALVSCMLPAALASLRRCFETETQGQPSGNLRDRH
jgi:hypothetical protein